ncbi:MAG: DMT family transporter [Terriglobales bacterium]
MTFSPELVSTSFSLAAVFVWGTSDFLGGYAAQRGNAFLVTTIAHGSGLLLMFTLASLTHAPFLSERSLLWALVAGTSGGTALAIFYRALAVGRMGLTAPVAALLGAAIPTAFGIFTEGFPGTIRICGFLLAGIGIWLISRTEDGTGSEGIGLAALAGVGFAGFYLGMREAGDGSALWLATFTRTGGLIVTAIIVILTRSFREITPAGARWGMLAGFLDVTGTALFVRASQTGRLDTAVVLTSLYPAVTVLLARLILREHFTRWKAVGIVAAMLAVPLIAGG